MIVHVILGTKAQWIKMAPVLCELKRRGVALRIIDTGQHGELTLPIRKAFDIGEPDVELHRGAAAETVAAGLRWLSGLGRHFCRKREELRKTIFPGGEGMVLVHGDNLSTAWGVAMARRAGLALGIVEAGLRSGHPLHPFPEEILRLILPRAAGLLFAPSEQAVENLKRMRVRGKVVHTGGNTIADALRLFLDRQLPATEDFGLWNFHRLETLLIRRRLEKICRLLSQARSFGPVKFVVDLPTRPRLEKSGWLRRFEQAGVELVPVLPYPDFVCLLYRARYVASDGGSIQEECAILGIPCLLLRERSERPDGLGRNVALLPQVRPAAFFKEAESYRHPPAWPERSPCQCIVEEIVRLAENGSGFFRAGRERA